MKKCKDDTQHIYYLLCAHKNCINNTVNCNRLLEVYNVTKTNIDTTVKADN